MVSFTAVFVCVLLSWGRRGRRRVLAKPNAPGLHIGTDVCLCVRETCCNCIRIITQCCSVRCFHQSVDVYSTSILDVAQFVWTWPLLARVFLRRIFWAKGPLASFSVFSHVFLARRFMQAYVIVLSRPPHSIRTCYKCSSFFVKRILS